jgi:hypothetical protein
VPALPAVGMSEIWIENASLIAVIVAVLFGLRWSLRRLTRPEYVLYDRYGLEERAANEAWSAHRDEEAWEAVRLEQQREQGEVHA